MLKRAPTPSPLALAAILAASAIPFTAALAQEVEAAGQPAASPAASAAVLDSAPTPVAPAPASPPAAAAPIAAGPVIAPASQAETPAATSTRAKRTSSHATKPAAAVAARQVSLQAPPAAAAIKPAAGPAEPASLAPPVVFAPAPPVVTPVVTPVVSGAMPPAAPAGNNNLLVPLALGGVGLFGAAAGAALIGRRRRKALADDETSYDDTFDPQAEAAPVFAGETIIPAPLFAASTSDAHRWHERVILPVGPLPIGDEREALIARMVAAPPDADNPFHSAKRRRKRARMILASHEIRQREAASEPFDFRKFKPFSQTDAPEPAMHYDMTRVKETIN